MTTGCTPVPNAILSKLRTLSRTAALPVYLHLVVQHGYAQWYDLSQRQLSDDLAKSRPTVIEALGVLEELGFIRFAERGRGQIARALNVEAVCFECTVACHKTCKVSSLVKNETQLAPFKLWEDEQVDDGGCQVSDAVDGNGGTYNKGLKGLRVNGGGVGGGSRGMQIWKHWNATKVTVHKFVTAKQEKAIRKALEELDAHMSKEEALYEILSAISNFGVCYHDAKYRWSYKWTLEEFLVRGLHRFRDEAKPLERELAEAAKAVAPHKNFQAARGHEVFDNW